MTSTWFRAEGLSRLGLMAFSALSMWLGANGSARAAATFEVTLRDSRSIGAVLTVEDGDANDADHTVNGVIKVSGQTVGGYLFDGSISTTNSPGSGGIALETTSTKIVDQSIGAFAGAGTASIYASALGYVDPTGGSIFGQTAGTWLRNSGSLSDGTGTVESRYDATNNLSLTPTGTVIGSDSKTTDPLHPAQSTTVNTFPITIPALYTLNLLLETQIASGGGDFDTTATVSLFGIGHGPNPTPEPAMLAMWAFGALGFAAVRFRRRKA